jgi:simple sugar transport system ATP-binding protein
VILSVKDLNLQGPSGKPILSEINLEVHKGEIVGIAGIEGNGQAPLVDTIIGLMPEASGEIKVDGQSIVALDALDRRATGIGLIPEDRHRQGLLLSSPLWENAALGHQNKEPYARGHFIDRKGARAQTEAIIERFGVKTPGPDVPATALSGGNQQKLVVGREIMADPVVLIAAQPTRGIDIGAQAAVWEELKNARGAGMGIMLISADLDELIGLSDTIFVLFEGRLVAQLDPAKVTPETLGIHMTGGTVDQVS